MANSLHEGIGALKDLDGAVWLELDAVIKNVMVAFQHQLLQLELVLLNLLEQIFFPLLSSLVNVG